MDYLSLAIIGLIFSFIYSSAEISLICSNPMQIQVWKKQKKVFSQYALNILEKKQSYLTIILIGTNLANVIFTSFATLFFIQYDIIPTELIFPAFVVSVFSISFSNHGLGVYPLAISLFLLEFNINTEIGLAYGWLAWSCQAIITLIFGGLSFFVLPLFNSSDRNG